ncbi:hypothetical protein CEXT_738941 [Caerostris extrusa]|uniref:Uncharacterized protein n=1 Tax=Caerostris extrusa TaxID=172846 RepID=A0AAV4W949_CAEEX|nr:hypothetical protein CEXT_738941 [Caerostris extrusa]
MLHWKILQRKSVDRNDLPLNARSREARILDILQNMCTMWCPLSRKIGAVWCSLWILFIILSMPGIITVRLRLLGFKLRSFVLKTQYAISFFLIQALWHFDKGIMELLF